MSEDYRCPTCGFYRDTANHELGCEEGIREREDRRDALARFAGEYGTIPVGKTEVKASDVEPYMSAIDEVRRERDEALAAEQDRAKQVDVLREALRQAVRVIARNENRQRSREGQDFLAGARKALG